jgi:trans-2-enoyl-CoA reductase
MIAWVLRILSINRAFLPLAILTIVFISVYSYRSIEKYIDRQQILRQANIVIDASKLKAEKLKAANDEKKNSSNLSGTDDWHSWANRLQQQNTARPNAVSDP